MIHFEACQPGLKYPSGCLQKILMIGPDVAVKPSGIIA
jgi:hypothetical protein